MVSRVLSSVKVSRHLLCRTLPVIRVYPVLVMVAAMLVTGGCSYNYVSDDGGRRVIGLASIEMVPADDLIPYIGDVVTVQGAGLVVNMGPQTANATLGYVSETSAVLRHCPVAPPLESSRCAGAGFSRLDWTDVTGLFRERTLAGGGKAYFGLIHAVLPPTDTSVRAGGTAHELEMVGVGYSHNEIADGVVIGYDRTALAAIAPDSFVMGNPVAFVP